MREGGEVEEDRGWELELDFDSRFGGTEAPL